MSGERKLPDPAEYALPVPAPASQEAWSARRRARVDARAKLDWRLAWVVTCVPFLGLVMAITLLFCGYGIGPVEVGLWLGMHVVTLIGVEVGFHRHFSHRAFQTYQAIRVLLAILGSMAFQGPVIWWAATHRRHHRYSDRSGDPHSPHLQGEGRRALLRGLWHAHIGWLFVSESTRPPGWDKYARDLYRDRTIFRVHILYFYLLLMGFAIPALLGGVLTWTWKGVWLGFLWGGLVRTFSVNHMVWCANSITHRFGSRPFASHDWSTNNIWLSIPSLGQAWHNNHHAFPRSALTGLEWWQVDVGGWVIRVLAMGGLAWDVKSPTARMIEARKGVSATRQP